jgi:hypothetical protein
VWRADRHSRQLRGASAQLPPTRMARMSGFRNTCGTTTGRCSQGAFQQRAPLALTPPGQSRATTARADVSCVIHLSAWLATAVAWSTREQRGNGDRVHTAYTVCLYLMPSGASVCARSAEERHSQSKVRRYNGVGIVILLCIVMRECGWTQCIIGWTG